MTQPAYRVGYARPPEHTRFQKGKSGNPGGKPGPKKMLRRQFDATLGEALNGSCGELRDAKSATVIEALARKIARDALDGRSSAQKLVLANLDEGEAETVVPSAFAEASSAHRATADQSALRQAQADEGSEDDDDEEAEEEEPFVYDNEDARQALGDRYDEFKRRFEWAMNKGTLKDLEDLAADFGEANFRAATKCTD